ncbi:hypothetical protein J5U22_01690 [Saccharolobus shibatae]|uniref:Uncharacterized protein n=1 Tax=Saccharolobus shibatae TaxID=2286 RepID=A0A8F5GZA8_9CREN|nr:hypothetical protein J5U22_01690 [Saccharolobus shibatae]
MRVTFNSIVDYLAGIFIGAILGYLFFQFYSRLSLTLNAASTNKLSSLSIL